MAHEFLSDDWFDAAEALRGQFGEPPASIKGMLINVTVTGGPSGDKELHLEEGDVARGHVEGAPSSLSTEYDIARKMFIDGDQAAGMQAFMTGKIKLGGDTSKLMALQAAMASPQQQERLKKLSELTA